MHTTVLTNPQAAKATLDRLWQWLKPRLMDGHRITLTVAEEDRTLAQNAHIHPLVRRIAVAAERPLDVESLRELRYLLLEQWRHDTNRKPLFSRSLDGERWVYVNGGTSDLDKPDCSEFLDWLLAWEATHGGAQ